MKTLKYKDKNGEYQVITPLVINQGGNSLPEDGEVGQVLTKTEDGVEWKDLSSNDYILPASIVEAASESGTVTQEEYNEIKEAIFEKKNIYLAIEQLSEKEEESVALYLKCDKTMFFAGYLALCFPYLGMDSLYGGQTAISIDIDLRVTLNLEKIDVATQGSAGLISASDKIKLDSLKNYTLPEATSTVLGGVKIWTGTQSQYDSLGTKSSDVFYFITE